MDDGITFGEDLHGQWMEIDGERVRIPSPQEIAERNEQERRELDEHWERVAATPWHKRNLLSIEELLTPPLSRWARAIYYVVVPFVVIAAVATNLILLLAR